jgi:hypothetical protein
MEKTSLGGLVGGTSGDALSKICLVEEEMGYYPQTMDYDSLLKFKYTTV